MIICVYITVIIYSHYIFAGTTFLASIARRCCDSNIQTASLLLPLFYWKTVHGCTLIFVYTHTHTQSCANPASERRNGIEQKDVILETTWIKSNSENTFGWVQLYVFHLFWDRIETYDYVKEGLRSYAGVPTVIFCRWWSDSHDIYIYTKGTGDAYLYCEIVDRSFQLRILA